MAAASKRTKGKRRTRRKQRTEEAVGPSDLDVAFGIESLARTVINASPEVKKRRADMEKALAKATGKPRSLSARTRAVRSF